MKDLKIRVADKAESKEVQELLFELGVKWRGSESRNPIVSSLDYPFFAVSGHEGLYLTDSKMLSDIKEITLQELRDMVNQDQDEPFLTPETTLNDQYAEIEQVRKHRHYFKDVSNIAEIDVYAVLKLFEVTDPCLQHIVKKALCAGKRGHKDMMEDLQNIVDTAIRAVELNS